MNERKYDALIISSIIVLFSVLWLFGTVNFVKEIKTNNHFTGFAISNQETNESQPQEIYSIKSYTIFYMSITGIILVIAIISLIMIIPRIKKYT